MRSTQSRKATTFPRSASSIALETSVEACRSSSARADRIAWVGEPAQASVDWSESFIALTGVDNSRQAQRDPDGTPASKSCLQYLFFETVKSMSGFVQGNQAKECVTNV